MFDRRVFTEFQEDMRFDDGMDGQMLSIVIGFC